MVTMVLGGQHPAVTTTHSLNTTVPAVLRPQGAYRPARSIFLPSCSGGLAGWIGGHPSPSVLNSGAFASFRLFCRLSTSDRTVVTFSSRKRTFQALGRLGLGHEVRVSLKGESKLC